MKKLMKRLWLFVAVIVVSTAFAGCSKVKEYCIGINVPPGTNGTVFSSTEVVALKNKIVISAGENLPETDVILQPTDVKTETAYEPIHVMADLPYKIEVEKGASFKIGVDVQNTNDENIVVYVNVRNVDVKTE